jgi:hypothetical protein
MIGEMFQSVGVNVHYSQIDNDDTLAAYAEANGAAVLSRDRDFFRYNNSSYPIFYDFQVDVKETKSGAKRQ